MAKGKLPGGIGPTVRKLRTQAGLTQAQLAEAADIADATLSRIEKGRMQPSLAMAEKLAKALRIPVDALRTTPRESRKSGLRPSEAKLLAVVREMDDAAVEDLARALRLIVAAARRPARR